MDGTLFDTERLSKESWEETGRALGWAGAMEAHHAVTGCNRERIRAWMKAHLDPDFPVEEFLQTAFERFQKRVAEEGVPLKPGVLETLQFFQAYRIPMALATSTSLERTLHRLELTGLAGRFPVIVTGDQVRRSKPDPEIYLLACQRLGSPPARTLAVEDSPNGVRSAAAAGLRVVMVPDLIPATPELAALADAVHPSLFSLLDALTPLPH